jgi:dimethylargininase
MLALIHLPSPHLDHGQRTHVARVPVDYDLALRQHAEYCRMLRGCGATVVTLDVNSNQPDGTFIEDTAVVLDEVAVVASMGTQARHREPAGIEQELRKYRELRRMQPPATLEGGDVLRIGRTLLVGLSACTALPDGRLLVNPAWLDMQALPGFETVAVPKDEPWAANTLPINGIVCIAAEHVQTAALIRRRGFDVRTFDHSEFAKVEGGVTCLSLMIDEPSTVR